MRERLGLPPETTLACTVGALVPHKDHVTLLHAARRLAGRFPDLHWVIAGEGELRQVLEWLAGELGLTTECTFWDRLPIRSRVIADADLYVMSSREEGLGTSVLDAMARGIPVASTSAGGLPEMLHEGAGSWCPPRQSRGAGGGGPADPVRRGAASGPGRACLARGRAIQRGAHGSRGAIGVSFVRPTT